VSIEGGHSEGVKGLHRRSVYFTLSFNINPKLAVASARKSFLSVSSKRAGGPGGIFGPGVAGRSILQGDHVKNEHCFMHKAIRPRASAVVSARIETKRGYSPPSYFAPQVFPAALTKMILLNNLPILLARTGRMTRGESTIQFFFKKSTRSCFN